MLLMIALLGIWVALCAAPREDPMEAWLRIEKPGLDLITRRNAQGFPLVFADSKRERVSGVGWVIRREYYIGRFLADLGLALATAYIFAMAVDRLVFPLVRRLHRKKPEQGESG